MSYPTDIPRAANGLPPQYKSYSRLLGQLAEGFAKCQAFGAHHEGQNVAAAVTVP